MLSMWYSALPDEILAAMTGPLWPSVLTPMCFRLFRRINDLISAL